MKIKRFEAASMSDALRRIKKEFGEDAVILSAKSVKKTNGLVGNSRSKKVVVTAAIDEQIVPAQKQANEGSVELPVNFTKKTEPGKQKDSNKFHFLKRFNPITRTGQQKLQSKFVQLVTKPKEISVPSETIYDRLRSQGLYSGIAEDFEKKMVSLMTPESQEDVQWRSALSQVLQAKDIISGQHSTYDAKDRIMVLVGPGGCGKTTLVAKLAAAHVKTFPGTASFFSLDDQKVAAMAELERYGRIMGIPLSAASRPEDVHESLEKMNDKRLVVVDTPSLGPDDMGRREQLRRMIASIPGAEIYLVLNADSQDNTMRRMIQFFKPLGVKHLVFTRLDWATTYGPMINQAIDSNLPIHFVTDTSKIAQPIQRTTARYLAELLLPDSNKDSQNASGENTPESTVRLESERHTRIDYVANRNSDIFHKRDCRSVQRINNDNMVVFNDPAEAMGQRFKPCRMCCSELLISKPIQRVARQYASSR